MINQELINFAHHLADISGVIAKKYFRSSFDEIKKEDSSPVTQADKQIEIRLRDEISKKYPEHGIIGEEFDNEYTNSEYKWVIDPIDGTISFAIGKPIFGTLIALTYQDQPILGIINQPINNERWWGTINGKSYFNDEIINTKNCQSISEAVFCTQSPFFFKRKRDVTGSNYKLFDLFKEVDSYFKSCATSGGLIRIILQKLVNQKRWYKSAKSLPRNFRLPSNYPEH